MQETREFLSKTCNISMSKPSKTDIRQNELFKNRLSVQLNPDHPLFTLSKEIQWSILEESFAPLFSATTGHPPLPVRLVTGILMLQHMEGLSDEEVVAKWVENPYWQFFCGYDYLQWNFPMHPTSLTHWRKRLGVEGMEAILKETIKTALTTNTIEAKDLQDVIADTTVMEKAVAHPTDSRLLNKAREKLVLLAKTHDIPLRQTYKRVGQQALWMAGRYGHAGQFKRMKKQIKKLKIYLGRVVRDIGRRIEDNENHQAIFKDLLEKSQRLLTQTKDSKNKLYSLHAPEVECIAKGKAHKRYEFGCKVGLAVTLKQGLALSSKAFHGNPYDGHTLSQTLSQAHQLTGVPIKHAMVDKGYKGHGVTDVKVYISGTRNLATSLKRALKRRSAIEPHIGHMKQDGKLGRNYLKGILGDQLNALLVAIGHNLRLIRTHLWVLLSLFFIYLKSILYSPQQKNEATSS